jgi:hypothetical protein
MAIYLSDLEQASSRIYRAGRLAKSMNEARALHLKTAFLCHSHEDKKYVEGLQVMLEEQGWQLYVDWQDGKLPSSPNAETAAGIKQKIRETDWFLFLASPNSISSRWCPWEIGIADGIKHHDNIVIVQTIDRSGNYHGNEYLQLYRHINITKSGKYALFRPGESHGTFFSYL